MESVIEVNCIDEVTDELLPLLRLSYLHNNFIICQSTALVLDVT